MEINKPVATIIILVITLILTFLLAWPKYQESSGLQKEMVEKQAEYNGKSVYFQKISQVLLQIENKKDSLEKINNALPDNISFAPLVYFLQKKGTETGLILKSITFSQISPAIFGQQSSLPEGSIKEIKNIAFTVNVLGNYQGLKNFLASLENSARIFEMNTISFASQQSSVGPAQQNSKSQIYDFKLSLKTHTY